MDRRELQNNPQELWRIAMAALQANLWTALPGVVTAFNSANMTVAVQPVINGRATNPDQTYTYIQMPILLDCPLIWPRGGGATMTFPIVIGDECLVVFSSRCIDSWWSQGWLSGTAANPNNGNNPLELRMHNLSDGFCFVGPKSKPNANTFTYDTTDVCITSDDGQVFVKVNPIAHTVTATAPGGINLNGVTIDSSGNLVSPATITASTDVVQGSGGSAISLKNHVHSGVQTGGGDTGAPVPGT